MSLIRPSDYGYAVLLWVYLQVRLPPGLPGLHRMRCAFQGARGAGDLLWRCTYA